MSNCDYFNLYSSYCSISGYYCSTQNVTEDVIYKKKLTCANATVTKLCSSGYYCPSATEKIECPSGYFCPQGFSEPLFCTWGVIECPYTTMIHPIYMASFAMFLAAFCILLVSFKILVAMIIRMQNVKMKEIKKDDIDDKIEAEIRERVISLKYENMYTILCTEFKSRDGSQRALITSDALFNAIDEDNSGVITVGELSNFNRNRIELIDEIVNEADGNMNGTLERHEFKEIWHKFVLAKRTSTVHGIDKSNRGLGYIQKNSSSDFCDSIIDKHGSESITVSALRDFLRSEEVDEALINEILAEADRDFDMTLNKEELFNVWQNILASIRNIPVPNSTSDEDTFRQVPLTYDVSFSNLYLHLPNNKAVLRNVSGKLGAGQVTALMGPSGAGKTSLLNLLRGQAHYARVTGNVYVNGKSVESLAPFCHKMAFVPQDDIMYDELTVRENIIFYAMIFNKRGYKHARECAPFASYVEKLLGIDFLTNSIVGSVEKRGISGGQRKRVSVAMEIMKEPALFFLDEPTSGLDSATSLSLMYSLRHLSKKGVNIICTIHQPRYEILEQIDNILLLAPGGAVAYFGPAATMNDYFSQNLKYTCPPKSNIADFVMDVLSGFVIQDNSQDIPTFAKLKKSITQKWKNYNESKTPVPIEFSTNNDNHQPEVDSELVSNLDPTVMKKSSKNDLLLTFKYVLLREIKIYQRESTYTIRASCACIVLGMIIGLLFGSVGLRFGGGVGASLNSSQLAYGLVVITSGLKLFTHDTTMRIREEDSGIRLLPLFLGKVFASLFEVIFYPLSFLMGYYPFINAIGSFRSYLILFILLQIALMGLANFISICFTSPLKNIICIGTLVVLWAFGGFSPSYDAIKNSMGPMFIINYLSPFKWSFQLQLILEAQKYPQAWSTTVTNTLSPLGWEINNKIFCITGLSVYCIVANFLAYISLEIRRDNFLLLVHIYESCNIAFKKFYSFLKPTNNTRSPGTVYVTTSDENENHNKPLVQRRTVHYDMTKNTDSMDNINDGDVMAFTVVDNDHV